MSVRLCGLDSVSSNESNGKEYGLQLAKKYYVGRDQKVDIVIQDKRCSRKQALLSWENECLTVTPLGTNPVFLIRNEEDPKNLTKNKPAKLENKDKVCFLALEHPFLILYPNEESNDKSNESDDDDDVSLEIDLDDDNSIMSEEEEEEEDNRPKCNYGAECYRSNPDHVRKFYHPHKDANGKPRKVKKEKQKTKPSKKKETKIEKSENDEMDIDIELENEEDKKEQKDCEMEEVQSKLPDINQVSAPSSKIIGGLNFFVYFLFDSLLNGYI